MGKYLDKIRQHDQGERMHPIETVKAAASPIVQAGSQITWTRADGTTQTGVVDYLHVDETGTRWAFITIGESWTAVNMKFATVSPHPMQERSEHA